MMEDMEKLLTKMINSSAARAAMANIDKAELFLEHNLIGHALIAMMQRFKEQQMEFTLLELLASDKEELQYRIDKNAGTLSVRIVSTEHVAANTYTH